MSNPTTLPRQASQSNSSKPSSASSNLQLIKFIILEESVTVLANNPDKHEARRPLVFNKDARAPKLGGPPSASPDCLIYYFSAYLGRFKCEEAEFFVFVNKVAPVRLGKYTVYKVMQVCVYPMFEALLDPELSDLFNELLVDKAYFSHDIDLTQNAAEAYRSGRFSLNPFFASLSNLISGDLLPADSSWYCPVVVGRLDSLRQGPLEFHLLYRESCFGVSGTCGKDLALLSDFYTPTALRSFDCLVTAGDRLVAALALNLANLPGLLDYANDDKERLHVSNFNPKRTYRFVQFFNEFLACRLFLVGNTAATRRAFRSIHVFVTDKDQADSGKCCFDKFVFLGSGKDEQESLLQNLASFAQHLGEESLCDDSVFFNLNVSLIVEEAPPGLSVVLHTLVESALKNPKLTALLPPPDPDPDGQATARKLFLGGFSHFAHRLLSDFQRAKAVPLKRRPAMPHAVSFQQVYPCVFGERHFLSRFMELLSAQEQGPGAFVQQKLRVGLVTHNCCGNLPESAKAVSYLRHPGLLASDLLFVGLQEILEMKSKNLRSIITNENDKQVRDWVDFFTRELRDFVLIGMSEMLGLLLLVLVRKDAGDRFDVTLEKRAHNKFGFMNMLANKGFLSLRLKVNFESVTLVNCHLQSGNSRDDLAKRVEQLRTIVDHFDKARAHVVSFVLGDTNFRCELPGTEGAKPDGPGLPAKAFDGTDVMALAPFDQLRNFFASESLNDWHLFEEPIRFPPSFKFVTGTSEYSSLQTPSW